MANPEDIVSYIESLKKERDMIEDQVIDVAYWMKGGMTLDEAFTLSSAQREKIIVKIEDINKKMYGGNSKEFL